MIFYYYYEIFLIDPYYILWWESYIWFDVAVSLFSSQILVVVFFFTAKVIRGSKVELNFQKKSIKQWKSYSVVIILYTDPYLINNLEKSSFGFIFVFCTYKRKNNWLYRKNFSNGSLRWKEYVSSVKMMFVVFFSGVTVEMEVTVSFSI